MRRANRTLLCSLLLMHCALPATGAEPAQADADAQLAEPASLADQMTPAQFKAFGLDKLSAAELARLQDWISRTRQSSAAAPAATPRQASKTAAASAPAATAAPAAAASAAAEVAQAEAAARAAQAEAEAALAAALAAEAAAREQAEAAEQRKKAAEEAAAAAEERAAQKARELAAAEAEPFQNGRWVGPKPKKIEARIDGLFEGWRGDTVFVLDNGEIWKQRLGGQYFHKTDSPEVLITRNRLGFYSMEIVETGKSVGVTRVR